MPEKVPYPADPKAEAKKLAYIKQQQERLERAQAIARAQAEAEARAKAAREKLQHGG